MQRRDDQWRALETNISRFIAEMILLVLAFCLHFSVWSQHAIFCGKLGLSVSVSAEDGGVVWRLSLK